MLLFAQLATVLIFAGSLILLVAAALLYVPLLCYIQGNLKEYVCHKVDKVCLPSMDKKVDAVLMVANRRTHKEKDQTAYSPPSCS